MAFLMVVLCTRLMKFTYQANIGLFRSPFELAHCVSRQMLSRKIEQKRASAKMVQGQSFEQKQGGYLNRLAISLANVRMELASAFRRQ